MTNFPIDIMPDRWYLRFRSRAPTKVALEYAIDIWCQANWIKRPTEPANLESPIPHQLKDIFAGLYSQEASDKTSTMVKGQAKSIAIHAPLTFCGTFDAISEFSANNGQTQASSAITGLVSLVAVLVIQAIALWQADWHPSLGLILTFCGYVGIVVNVTTAALLLRSFCNVVYTASLRGSPASGPHPGAVGICVPSNSPDSMDTKGHVFMQSSSRSICLELVSLKDATRSKQFLASVVSAAMVASFICHYLGLRSCQWWVSVGEVAISLLAAIARSAFKHQQEQFIATSSVRLDKKCISIGYVANWETAQKVQVTHRETQRRRLDFRAYSRLFSSGAGADTHLRIPTGAERIAWHVACLCNENEEIANKLLSITKMRLANFVRDDTDENVTIVFFSGGFLVSEGLAYPTVNMVTSFTCHSFELAAPTCLIARCQSRWMVQEIVVNLGLGDVHIPSSAALLSWWTVSEGSNDMGDLQDNLQWALLLIKIAFFVALLQTPDQESSLIANVRFIHRGTSLDEMSVAKRVAAKLSSLTLPKSAAGNENKENYHWD